MDKKLLQKFKAGKCSPEEVRKILLWYQSEEAETSFSIELENYWNDERDLPFSDADKVRHQILQKTALKEHGKGRNHPTQSKRRFLQKKRGYKTRISIAATVLLLLATIPLLYFKTSLLKTSNPEPPTTWITKETKYGQRNTIRLPDGTIVKLNSGSRILFPEVFPDSLRWVEFEGEAFFDVVKETAKPFVIRSGHMNTMVLGTSFNLKTNTKTEGFELAVVTGSVKVTHHQHEQIQEERYINSSQSAIWSPQNKTFYLQGFDPTSVLGWVEGILAFDNASFGDIVFKLEKWYGVQIDTSNLTYDIPSGYTGKYSNKSLETVLHGISYVLGFNYEIKGKKVIIK